MCLVSELVWEREGEREYVNAFKSIKGMDGKQVRTFTFKFK